MTEIFGGLKLLISGIDMKNDKKEEEADIKALKDIETLDYPKETKEALKQLYAQKVESEDQGYLIIIINKEHIYGTSRLNLNLNQLINLSKILKEHLDTFKAEIFKIMMNGVSLKRGQIK